MNEMNNGIATEKKNVTVEKNDGDYSRYLAYQEAVKLLRGNADGGK